MNSGYTCAPAGPSRLGLTFALLALGTLTVLFTGCASPHGVADGGGATTNTPSAPLVWPSPPAEARIEYVGSIASDVGVRERRWSKIVNSLTGRSIETEHLSRPFGVALDADDNLCLADPGAGSVYFFDRKRHVFKSWSKIGGTEFVAPVAVAKYKDVLFVADSELKKVLAFTTSGQLRFEIAGKVERPSGLAIAGEHLLVADAQAHAIVVFDFAGKPISSFGTPGAGPGEFNAPTHLAVGGTGEIYVTDSMNFRVQVFDSTGHYLRSIGGVGDSTGHFSRPKGVAVDTFGHVYVVDTLFDNVQVFDQQGHFLLDWGCAGSDRGQFWMPAGIAISRDNLIFVADSYNQRVQVFKYVGKP